MNRYTKKELILWLDKYVCLPSKDTVEMELETLKKALLIEKYTKQREEIQKERELNFEQLKKLEDLYNKETNRKAKKELNEKIIKLSWKEFDLLGNSIDMTNRIGDCVER